MKKIMVVCLSVLLLCGGSAFAAKKAPGGAAAGLSVDVGGLIGTEPGPGWGSALGFSIGGSYDLSRELNAPVKARADLSYLNYKEEFTFFSVKSELQFRRIPLFLGGRYMFPAGQLKAFGELGLELSFDKFETSSVVPGFGFIPDQVVKGEVSETNFGLTPGVGIEYPVSPTVSIGANARYHIIDGDYFSLGAFVGFNIQ